MKIPDPVLAPDVSNWVTRLNAKEMEDGGCQSVIVGLYPQWQNGVKILNPICREQCLNVMRTGMVLQAYYWDDITDNPIEQADWLVSTIKSEGFPVKWVWSDQEQWWIDWSAWYLFKQGKLAEASVPRASGFTISSHNLAFNQRLKGKFPEMGVYCNKGFISTYAPSMDTWLPQYKTWIPHYGRQPVAVTTMSWQQLKSDWMPNYDIILSSGQPPENVMGHQFTGDRIRLPGSYNQFDMPLTLDVSVFRKTFIDSLKGVQPVPTHPDICPTCGQPWPQTPNPEPQPIPETPPAPAYRIIPGHNPYVRSSPAMIGDSPDVPGNNIVLPVLMWNSGIVLRIDSLVIGGYSHFLPIESHPNGGYVSTSMIEKV